MLKIGKSPESQHVRDCMTWHYGYSAGQERTPHYDAPSERDTNNRVFSGTKYATGYTFNASANQDYVPETTHVYNNNPYEEKNLDQMTCQKKQDDAGDALRGWPGQNQPDLTGFDHQEQAEPSNDPKKDPYMADLMAHAYMKKNKGKGKDGRDSANKRPNLKSGGKPTRTSMMRHIVNNEKAHPVEDELWKMSKFTKGAKSAVSSFRAAQSGDKNKKRSAHSEGAGMSKGMSPSAYGFGADAQNGGGGYTWGQPSEENPYATGQPFTYTSHDAMTRSPPAEQAFKLPPISPYAAQDQSYSYNYTGNNYERPPSNGGIDHYGQTMYNSDKPKNVTFEVAL